MEIKDIPVEQTIAKDTDYFILQDPTTGITYKIAKKNLLSGSTTGSSVPPAKLAGTPFGASPPYDSSTDYPQAFDGNLVTFYDYYQPSGGYVGLDLGVDNSKKLTKVRIYPRQYSGIQTRSGNGIIQGGNTNQTDGFTDLAQFPSTPDLGTWYELSLSVPIAYIGLVFDF